MRTDKATEEIAQAFHALSDLTRLRLLERLQTGEQCVCDLTDAFQTGQSRLSFHLKVLKKAGLVNDRRDGRWMYYSVNPKVLEDLQEYIAERKQVMRRGAVASKCC